MMSKEERSFSEKMIFWQCLFAFILLLLVGFISICGFFVEPKGVIDTSVISIVSIFLGVAGAMFGINSFADNRKYTANMKYNAELVKLHDELLQEVRDELTKREVK